MSISIYLQENFEYNDITFIIKVFYDDVNFLYTVKVFFFNNKQANNFSYSVKYTTKADLLAYTGDNAIAILVEHAKEDIKSGNYFNTIL